uniref:Uncharacterized protein n=1 Tax=Amphimedon queenslandica TaxID=400682 RepID=A0A1X7T8A2_AMPQE
MQQEAKAVGEGHWVIINIIIGVPPISKVQGHVKPTKTTASDKVHQILKENAQLKEEKQIITKHYEKLKIKVADITELMEEKEKQYLKEKQIFIDDVKNLKIKISERDKIIAKLTSQVEEQSQNEKQTITDLRIELSDKDFYITKLVKEKEEKVLKQSKSTSSIGLQFNYLIPSMNSLDSSVIIAGQKLFTLQGDRSHSFQWEKYGFRL